MAPRWLGVCCSLCEGHLRVAAKRTVIDTTHTQPFEDNGTSTEVHDSWTPQRHWRSSASAVPPCQIDQLAVTHTTASGGNADLKSGVSSRDINGRSICEPDQQIGWLTVEEVLQFADLAGEGNTLLIGFDAGNLRPIDANPIREEQGLGSRGQ